MRSTMEWLPAGSLWSAVLRTGCSVWDRLGEWASADEPVDKMRRASCASQKYLTLDPIPPSMT